MFGDIISKAHNTKWEKISRSGDTQNLQNVKNVSYLGENFENPSGRHKPWAFKHFKCHIRIPQVKKPGVTAGKHMHGHHTKSQNININTMELEK